MNIIYYTCNTHLPEIDDLCRKYLSKIDLPIITVSLNKPINFGDKRIVVKGERSPLMMHKQIVIGLEASDAEYVFLAESDVLYHKSHFDFKPIQNDIYYFNVNVWKMRWKDGHCVRTDNSQQLSGMCASRELLLNFFKNRVAQIEKEGWNRHYEPREGRENYQSEICNICIRHDGNLTGSKWKVSDFKNKRYAKGWKETEISNIKGWNLKEIYNETN